VYLAREFNAPHKIVGALKIMLDKGDAEIEAIGILRV
jgi:hypothetical protein